MKGDVNKLRLRELRQIAKKHGGVLQPDDVVSFAQNPRTALHSVFCWNDTEAAKQWRLEQARRMIRVIVVHEPRKGEDIQAFVALRSERYNDGGYRYMPTLMTTEDGRMSVLETALWELVAFQKKYKRLKELSNVFEAIESLKRKHA